MSQANGGNRKKILLNCIRMHKGSHQALHGNFSHLLNLYRELVRQGVHDYIIHADAVTHPVLQKEMPDAQFYTSPNPVSALLEQEREIRRAISHVKPAVYVKPTGQLPLWLPRCKTIFGVADLGYLHLPMSFAHRAYKRLSYRRSAKRADRIICVSESTRRQVIEHLRVQPEKAAVVHHGTTRLTVEAEVVQEVNTPFFITFGHQRHKNVEACIRAIAVAETKYGLRSQLAIIGICPNKNELEAVADAEGVRSRVTFLGRMSDGQLRFLYQNAVALLFLSRHEGFGLPILEAMGEGCPVIGSNAFSIPEVMGNAGPLFDVDDFQGVAMACRNIHNDGNHREDLVQKGHARAERFSWERAAQETAEIYQAVLCD